MRVLLGFSYVLSRDCLAEVVSHYHPVLCSKQSSEYQIDLVIICSIILII